MKTFSFLQKTPLPLTLAIALLLLTNCKKPPEPDFSFSPADNPEAGDTIKFSNLTEEAQSYSWDFGNGSVSSDEHPFTFYETTGNKEVTLTATNEAGSASVSKTIMINDPTILGFFVYSDTLGTVLPGCEIWVYDNEYDYNQFNVPQFLETTDSEGIAVFMNLEPQIYYIIAYKEETNGAWIAGGNTQPLTQNEIVVYDVVCQFVENQTKKSLLNPAFSLTSPRGVIKPKQVE